jgi:EmrB/QacA subfamily drug resistance transporter
MDHVESSRQRWVLALTSAAAFMTALDAMVVAAALPALRDDLHAPVESLQWTVSAYNLCFAVCLMTGSALGERLGRRRVLAAGLLAFVGGSIGCALSGTLAWLVAWRSVQGVASALIAPVAMAILSSAFAGPQRARALGLFGSITGVALIAGPALGGAVTQGLSWPWVFWINVPFGIGLAFLVQRRIVDGKGAPAPIDAMGALLLVVAALGLAWALLREQVVGWRTLEAAGSAAAGAAFLAGFVVRCQRVSAPMVAPRLFAGGRLAWALAASATLYAPLYGTLFMLPQLLGSQVGTAFESALKLLPWTATLFVVAPLAGSLAGRFGERPVAIAGLGLQAVGLGALALGAGNGAPFAVLAPAMILAGIGTSAAMPALQSAAMTSVAPPDIGQVSGVFNTVRFFAGFCGIALATETFVRVAAAHGVRPLLGAFEAALAVLAAVSVLGVFFASRLAQRRPRIQGQGALPARE